MKTPPPKRSCRLRLLPAYYLFPLMAFPFELFFCVLYYFGPTTSDSRLTTSTVFPVIVALMTVGELATVSLLHFFLHYLLTKTRLRLPPIVVNLPFATMYMGRLLVCFTAMEQFRECQALFTMAYLRAYVMIPIEPVIFRAPADLIVGEPIPGSSKSETIRNAIRQTPGSWAPVIGALAAAGIAIIVLTALGYREFLASLRFGQRAEPLTASALWSARAKDHEESDAVTPLVAKASLRPARPPAKVFRSAGFFITATMAAVFVPVFIYFIVFQSVLPGFLDRYATAPMLFLRSGLDADRRFFTFGSEEYQRQVRLLRRAYQLPAGHCWLDNREVPEYPLVHAPASVCRAYGHDIPDVDAGAGAHDKAHGRAHGTTDALPNVVLLVVESLTPQPPLILEDALLRQKHGRPAYMDTPYYDPDMLPALAWLAENGVTFTGVAALGLPTLTGLNGLLSGLPQSTTAYVNVLRTLVESDDAPSLLRDFGYSTLFVNPAPFDFDGLGNWVFRAESAAVDGARRFPRWFDDVVYYHPTCAQAATLGVPCASLRRDVDFVCDRVTARQLQHHFLARRAPAASGGDSGGDRPVFAVYKTIETHTPFSGFDRQEFFDAVPPPARDASRRILARQHRIFRRYFRTLRYTDHYVLNGTLAFLREHAPNTIVVVLGDHGAREVPRYGYADGSPFLYEADGQGNGDGIVPDERCLRRTFGSDGSFLTTATLAYLGDDPAVRAAVYRDGDRLRGRVFTFPGDHNDVVYTLASLLGRLAGRELPPSARLSRDLLDAADEVWARNTTSTPAAPWFGSSVVHYQLEARTQDSVFRSNIFGDADAILFEDASFPVCARPNRPSAAPPAPLPPAVRQARFEDALARHRFLSYLVATNRVYSFRFRDAGCVQAPGSGSGPGPGPGGAPCALPTPAPADLAPYLFLVVVLGYVLLAVLFAWALVGANALALRLVSARRAPALARPLSTSTLRARLSSSSPSPAVADGAAPTTPAATAAAGDQ